MWWINTLSVLKIKGKKLRMVSVNVVLVLKFLTFNIFILFILCFAVNFEHIYIIYSIKFYNNITVQLEQAMCKVF